MAKLSARGRTLVAEWVNQHESEDKKYWVDATYRLMSDGNVLERYRLLDRDSRKATHPAGWHLNRVYKNRGLPWLEHRFANLKRTV